MTNETIAHTFLDNLRAQTHDSHKKLENLPVSSSITNPNLSIEQYAHYLQLMHVVIAETESHVFPKIASIVPDIELRRKLSFIERDLETIGSPIKQLRPVFKNPAEFSIPFALGIMYTVEGSTLGGRYILNNVKSALGFDQNSGATFFAGYGNATGSYWKNFLGSLNDFAADSDSAEIIDGAQYAFDAIYKHFATEGL